MAQIKIKYFNIALKSFRIAKDDERNYLKIFDRISNIGSELAIKGRIKETLCIVEFCVNCVTDHCYPYENRGRVF